MVPSNNDQALHQTFNFQNLYPDIDKQKIKWDKVVSGETDLHRKYVCIALSISTAIVAAAAIGAIVACVLSSTTIFGSYAFALIPIPLLLGGGSAVSLGIAAYFSSRPTDKGKNILSGKKKAEWIHLFTKGKLDNLKEYVYLKKLDSLIYQGVISSERGHEIVELLSPVSESELTNFYRNELKKTSDHEGEWKTLRDEIYKEIPLKYKNVIDTAA